MTKIIVLRWGHRIRDERLTTHVALAARALNATGMILADVKDEKIQKTINSVVKNWGGSFFLEMGTPWKTALSNWRTRGGIVVHLTAYGENIQESDVMQRIKAAHRDILLIVGSQKVPSGFFSSEWTDFNVAIGNQPHSECASLAVFLDRFYEGSELSRKFKDAKLIIIPCRNGKNLVSKNLEKLKLT